ncbi:MAG: hypothetical protein GVY29_06645, partial [Spirochaetes bacterium]|nr:hypothetical protein [Spirochaetota bacterium]
GRGGGVDATAGDDSTADSRAAEALAPEEVPGYGPVRALAKAYPDRVTRAEIRGGQWALEMDDSWYYWADGRLLPKRHIDEAESYVSLRFYGNYELGPPKHRQIPSELAARLRDRDSVGGNDERSRFNDFNDTLFGVSSRAEADATMVWMPFLGKRTRVHPMLEEPLRRVDDRIRKAASVDPETQQFLNELFQIHGYNWRNIAGTARRSYHAYGVAVDLLPIRWNGGWAYWQWAYDGGVEAWWDLPLEDRWMMPQPVIDAFEAEGFVWGGKWLFFDNMHFEYRPESIILAERNRRAE